MLEQHNKDKNPFKVPENYFENFHKDIMDKVGNQQPVTTRRIAWKKIVPWTAAAAVFAAVLMGTGILENTVSIGNENRSTELDDDYYSFIESEIVPVAYEEYIYNEEVE